MTREKLIEKVCPSSEIQNDECIDCAYCMEVLNNYFDEYEKQMRAEIIEECKSAIVNTESKVFNPCADKKWNTLTLLANRQFEILNILEELKG